MKLETLLTTANKMMSHQIEKIANQLIKHNLFNSVEAAFETVTLKLEMILKNELPNNRKNIDSLFR